MHPKLESILIFSVILITFNHIGDRIKARVDHDIANNKRLQQVKKEMKEKKKAEDRA